MTKPKLIKDEVAKLYTQQKGEEANLFIYGYIGDYYSDAADNITAINVRKAIDALVLAGAKVINARINSNGGYTSEGLGIITALKDCPVELHTWNDGVAYSMAADIWFAAKKENRHMAKGATLMIHAPSSGLCIGGTVKDFEAIKTTILSDIEKQIEKLDSIAEGTIAVMAEGTDMTADEIRTQFYDYADHTLTFQDCTKAGFINTTTETYTTETLSPTKTGGFLYKLKNFFSPENLAEIESLENTDNTEGVNDDDMITKENLQEALKKGEITLAEVTAIVEAEKAAQPINDQEITRRIDEVTKKFGDEIGKRDEEIVKLKKDVETAMNRSGGTPPLTPAAEGSEDANDPQGASKTKSEEEFEAYNKSVIEAKKSA
jgi:ATP-dependent protease ClpP protease subunit